MSKLDCHWFSFTSLWVVNLAAKTWNMVSSYEIREIQNSVFQENCISLCNKYSMCLVNILNVLVWLCDSTHTSSGLMPSLFKSLSRLLFSYFFSSASRQLGTELSLHDWNYTLPMLSIRAFQPHSQVASPDQENQPASEPGFVLTSPKPILLHLQIT